jgi:hypothetical protein
MKYKDLFSEPFVLRQKIIKLSLKEVTIFEFTYHQELLFLMYFNESDLIKRTKYICPELSDEEILKLTKEDSIMIDEALNEINETIEVEMEDEKISEKNVIETTFPESIDFLCARYGGQNMTEFIKNNSRNMITLQNKIARRSDNKMYSTDDSKDKISPDTSQNDLDILVKRIKEKEKK